MERDEMIRTQIASRGIRNKSILDAISRVPRHMFMPSNLRNQAYEDHAVPIGHGQTISQPYIVALMTQLLEVEQGDRILEIGTGSAYQAAVLAEMGAQVFSIEVVEELYRTAESRITALGYDSIHLKRGDGYYGWEEEAPFSGIIVTAAACHIPPPLIDQLENGGELVIPIGGTFDIQTLTVIHRERDGSLKARAVLPVRFVPFTGEALKQEP